MADRLDDLQRHGALGEQTQRPVGKPLRRWTEAQGDDLGFLLAVENLAADTALGLTVEGDTDKDLGRHHLWVSALSSLRFHLS